MAIISVPAKFSFTDISRFALQRASNILRSRYTGQSQRIVFPFAIWQLEGTLVDYDGAEAAAIRSFYAQLDGVKNTFRLPVPGYTKPSTGYIANRAVSIAAAARATSLTVSGGTPNAPYIGNGEYFMVQDELKLTTAPVAFNGAGQATINFKPALRKAVAVGVNVIVLNPTILMHATDDDVANWPLKPPYRHGFNFSAIEAIEI